MKYTTYLIAFAIFLAAACQRNEFPEDNSKRAERTLTIGIDDEAASRVGFDENNSFCNSKP